MSAHAGNDKQTYAIAFAIIIAFTLAMVWVTQGPAKAHSTHGAGAGSGHGAGIHAAAAASGGHAHPAPSGHAVRTGQAQPRAHAQPRPQVRRVIHQGALSDSAQARVSFATKTYRRLRARNYAVRIAAIGANGAIFDLSWPEELGAADRKHQRQLKSAEPFHNELRGRGFRLMRMRVGKRVVWSKKL